MNIHSTMKLNNSVEIPLVALGVFRIPNDQTADCVRGALEAGYRHIDAAAIYHNEQGVGKGVKDSGVAREDIFLTTKLWNEDMRAGRVREAFEESLEKLGTDYIDLYLVHWPVAGAFEKSWLEMEKLYKEGRIRAIGVSNFHQNHMESLLKVASIIPAVNQIELHPLLTQKPLTKYCRSLGIEIEAYCPLGGSGKFNLLKNEEILAIAQKYGRSAAQILIRWDLQNNIIVLPKSTHQERIVENINVFDFEITPEDMAALDAMNQNFRVNSDPDTFDF